MFVELSRRMNWGGGGGRGLSRRSECGCVLMELGSAEGLAGTGTADGDGYENTAVAAAPIR